MAAALDTGCGQTDRRTQGGGPFVRTLRGQHVVPPGARATSLAAPLKTYYNTKGSEARASTEAAVVAVALLVGVKRGGGSRDGGEGGLEGVQCLVTLAPQ